MSKREQLQNQIAEFLEANSQTFNAPYGVIQALEPIGKKRGLARTITFGIARYLDAQIIIWREERIIVQAEGGLRWKIEGIYESVEALMNALKGMVEK